MRPICYKTNPANLVLRPVAQFLGISPKAQRLHRQSGSLTQGEIGKPCQRLADLEGEIRSRAVHPRRRQDRLKTTSSNQTPGILDIPLRPSRPRKELPIPNFVE